MKAIGANRWGSIALICCAQVLSANAVTFTSDTFISATDLSQESQDITVTNCTLTVDGPHAFNSLQILNGAVLTHSPFTNGPQQIIFAVSGETQHLSAITPASLNNTNVDTNTIVVKDVSSSIIYTQNIDYVVGFSNQFTQVLLTTNSAVAEGAPILVSYSWMQNFQGFSLVISNDVQIAVGGAINISGRGYAGGNGFVAGAGTSLTTNFPFTLTAGGGGGHAGNGGMSSTFAFGGATYDSTTNPAVLGSGGGAGSTHGGAGGGVAQLFVGGILQLDGQISADGLPGTNAHSGGGAGGAVFVSAQNFSGAGAISASGGAGDAPDGGGGGGGGIAIYFATNNFTGTISAFGGTGANYGGAGAVYSQPLSDPAGQLVIVNNGVRGTNTSFSGVLSNLTISGGAIAQCQSSTFTVSNLFVGSNSWLVSLDSSALALTVSGDATIETNAAINANYKSATGSGAGLGDPACPSGSGGGYGGNGGNSACGKAGGGAYGVFLTQPASLGSPGGNLPLALGGGAVKLIVGGKLFLAGNLTANGASGVTLTNGGGSGGSIWLAAGSLLGGGIISADGGFASNSISGGGGGGRIAIYFDTNLFTGSISAYGGGGVNAGGAGTIFIKSNSTINAQFMVDNGGRNGLTTLRSQSLSQWDMTIKGGAVVVASGSFGNARSLLIASNSWWTDFTNSSAAIMVTNLTIQSGGGMVFDGESMFGSSGAQTVNSTGGGGGNGGYGGSSASNALGGAASSQPLNANPFAGFGGAGANGLGGLGGGACGLTVYGTLQLDGRISSQGLTSASVNSGGGAGGSLRLTAGVLSGTGAISANGGAGNNLGGGGGGGRIIINCQTNLFSGAITAYGGAGAQYGGAGFIYLGKTLPSGTLVGQQIIADNGGIVGASTLLLNPTGVFDLTVAHGAGLTNNISTPLTNGNLFVGSNSTFFIDPTAQQTLVILTNATIEAGGTICGDGVSYPGPSVGHTVNETGGGGGMGGVGGSSALGASGGGAFIVYLSPSFLFPTALGSGGGHGHFTVSAPSPGGGSLRMIVNGALQLDGAISAQGNMSAETNGGGGSGGSIWLSAGNFSGAGLISVNGGAAGGPLGGGGGGGRIALYYNTNTFTGAMTAYGGRGTNYGGAGTIYKTSNFSGNGPVTSLVVDNKGISGLTLIDMYADLSDLRITGGASVYYTNGIDSYSIPKFGNFFLGSNSIYFMGYAQTVVRTNATIEAGGIIRAEVGPFQHAGTDGPFASPGGPGGGGHGGYGGHGGKAGLVFFGSNGGSVTGSITGPILSGGNGGSSSGGTGGAGGGAMKFTVNSNLLLNGSLSADGGTDSVGTNSGGGAGGSIWFQANTLQGTGIISARGGAGKGLGGGGGGGRISIWFNTNLFTGSIIASGGAGFQNGGAGTIYLNSSFLGDGPSSRVIVDNGGLQGTNTGIISPINGVDVLVTNGASLSFGLTTNTVWNSLILASNSSLSLVSNFTSVNLTINSNFDLPSGSSINLDGQGLAVSTGTGHGGVATGAAGGGGHGGMGSAGTNANAFGGTSYDSITAPVLPGSGGGAAFAPATNSAGGGVLHLTVNGTFNLNGNISANGTAASASREGGGAGGSVWLTAETLSGAGKISADGANGSLVNSGGGGGGRIAVYFNSNAFTGTISARGGAGVGLSGGAGTIYLKTNSASLGQLIVDNGGSPGTNTPLASLAQTVDLSLAGGASADSPVPLTLQSLSIGSGASLTADTLTSLNLTVFGDAFIDTNGIITADASGFDVASGPGTGGTDSSNNGSGGGYGGTGGASLLGTPGGVTYGSSNQPVDFGSGGGMSPILAGYSRGGGAIRLLVNGALTLNGNITARGDSAMTNNSGGGSGGSIWVTTHNLSGTGTFVANGGAGIPAQGGGGGGGRIAIYAGTNSFSGNLFVAGASGASVGQDGTIYIATNLFVSGNVADRNGVGVAGITLQPSGLTSVMTDNSGSYVLWVPPIWTGTVTPAESSLIIPNLRSYSNLSSNLPAQNFLVASPSDFNMNSSQFDRTNVSFNWYGINGVVYQPLYSSNLVNWFSYGLPYIGSNAPVTFSFSTTNAPQLFFRLDVSY